LNRAVPDAPSYLGALIAGTAVFVLYGLTLAPTTQFWDASEYIATAHILGIPHPPGNPLFVLLARSWELLLAVLGLSVAVRVNLFSAFMSAAAHGLWFLVVQQMLGFFSSDRRVQLTGAATAVAVSATAFTVWNQSNVNEKVYTVSLLTIALISWLAFLWRAHLGRGKDDNVLVLIVFILALSVGNHLMAFLAAPALVAFVAAVHPRSLLNWKLYFASALAVVAGLSVHLFLPLRAGLHPIINEASPTCESLAGALGSILTWGQAGCAELSAALGRQQYDKPPLVPRLAPLSAQFANYLQYFDWQWSRAVGGLDPLFATARIPFTTLFTGLGVWGSAEHFRRDRRSWIYVFTLFVTVSVGLVLYLNFKYGYSIPAPVDDMALREVRERDYFFIVSFSLWGLWVGMGLTALWVRLRGRGTRLWSGATVLLLALLPLLLNWTWASRRTDYTARDWAYNLLHSVEPYAVLFTNGDNDTFPLWYLQEVEGIRRDVTVIVTSYLNTDWYVKQLRELTRPCPEPGMAESWPTRIVCQRSYRLSAGAAANQVGEGGAPTPAESDRSAPPSRSIVALPDSVIDAVAQAVVQLPNPMAYRVGSVDARLPAGMVLAPWHQFAVSIIGAAIVERPVYFASSGSSASDLGLDGHLVREGLAYRLYNGDLDRAAPPGGCSTTCSSIAPGYRTNGRSGRTGPRLAFRTTMPGGTTRSRKQRLRWATRRRSGDTRTAQTPGPGWAPERTAVGGPVNRDVIPSLRGNPALDPAARHDSSGPSRLTGSSGELRFEVLELPYLVTSVLQGLRETLDAGMEAYRPCLQLLQSVRLQLELLPSASPPATVLNDPVPFLTQLVHDHVEVVRELSSACGTG
jgi:hypothetical protein